VSLRAEERTESALLLHLPRRWDEIPRALVERTALPEEVNTLAGLEESGRLRVQKVETGEHPSPSYACMRASEKLLKCSIA